MTDQAPPPDDPPDPPWFNPAIYASALHFGSGLPRLSQRKRLRDGEIEDIVLDRQRGDGW